MSAVKRHVYHVCEDGCVDYWIVAESEAEIRERWMPEYSIGVEALDPVEVTKLPGDRVLEIASPDETMEDAVEDMPPGAALSQAPNGWPLLTATAGEWAAHYKSGTIIGGSEY